MRRGKASVETIVRKRSLPDVYEALGVSKRTVEAWETGRSTPSPTAKNLIYLISQKPDLVLMLQEARGDYSI